ncbi:MAG: transposon-transfer assisting family protein [Oscillospiraceae bacterium]|nr:transposon-transfer assisting family protein [Oscillospiraceae bacterium]
MNNFTHDELNLMSIYNSTGTREGLLRELAEMRGFLAEDETELLALTNSALDKLQAITDEEYVLLELFPDFE